MKIAIIDYNAGNTRSVQFALERLGATPILTKEPSTLLTADRVIFPGVGAASSAMKDLKKGGLDVVIRDLKQPVLGICLGMQLMCAYSEEGAVDGLGIFSEKVKRFAPQKSMKIPHMGWNTLLDVSGTLLAGIDEKDYVYFVHSYCAEVGAYTVASCSYGETFSAALQKDNFYATQFHPEKSGTVGTKILENFMSL